MRDPQRLDLESSSSAYRRRRCSGSVNLVRALREKGTLAERSADPDALSGSRIHAAWAKSPDSNLADLSVVEQETLTTLLRMEKSVVADWAGAEQYTLLGRELRLWLHDALEPIHSGAFDVAYGTLSTRRMLILDAKTGFGEVQPSIENDQLRELVALARFNYAGCREFCVAILAPNVAARPSVARYDVAEAELALRLLRFSLADGADPDAPRTPGPWCKYCPALEHCEEARADIGKTYKLAKRIEAGEFALPIGARGARILDSIEVGETALRALKNAYRNLIAQEPGSIPGWYMRPGAKVREITDVLKAYELVREQVSLEDFISATEVHIGELQHALGKALELGGKELEARFNQLLEPVISLKEHAPTLAKESNRKGTRRLAVEIK